jgi:O-antigen/teichoic acid export membrane protein
MVIAAGTVGLYLLSPEAVGLIGAGRYQASLPAVGLSLLAALVLGLLTVASLPALLAKATRDVALASMIGVAVAIVGGLVLAPRLGAAGTAAAVLGGSLTALMSMTWLTRTREPIRYGWSRILAVVAVAFAIVIGTVPVGGGPPGLRIVLGVGFAIIIALEGTIPATIRRARQEART